MKKVVYIFGLLTGLFVIVQANASQKELGSAIKRGHPKLLLTNEGVKEIKRDLKKYPLMQKSVQEVIALAQRAVVQPIEVPYPKDAGGGYTHEKHKQNYMDMYYAGISFQLTGDKKYATFIEKMLVEYSKLYPTLGLHPERREQVPGKLFWQGLNETVWLVYSIQAYDCVKETLSPAVRQEIENGVFRPMVHFFTVEDKHSFDRVHNHGTWSVASVGMAGIVLNEPEWIKMALWGTELDGKAGFLKQLDELFTPDGYYAEGPYYQRYALLPFVVFAQALENNFPQLRIFEYRESLLTKMVETTLQLTDDYGRFFPFNDAIKEKDYRSGELVFGVNIAYAHTNNSQLLSIVSEQGRVMISSEGLKVARDLAKGKYSELEKKSVVFQDGPFGNQGGVALMRNGQRFNGQTVVFKFATQGMGHGHFDRLHWMFYNNGNEVISDYGAARFVNVEPKFGGRYLPENNSWAKQTIAHNTVTLNRQSHFGAKLAKAEEYAPSLIFYDFSDINSQVVAAVDSNCYNNAILRRALALVRTSEGNFVLDYFDILAEGKTVADYSCYYQGQLVNTTFKYDAFTSEKEKFGLSNGYQHLWLTASSSLEPGNGFEQISFLNNDQFYTLSTMVNDETQIHFVRTGASDPDFNLRSEPGIIVSQPFNGAYSFFSVFEPHGSYDVVSEMVSDASSKLKSMNVLYREGDVAILEITTEKQIIHWMLSFNQADSNKTHKIKTGNEWFEWKGNTTVKIKSKLF